MFLQGTEKRTENRERKRKGKKAKSVMSDKVGLLGHYQNDIHMSEILKKYI